MFLDGYVLSLFDGMSCGQIALDRLGVVPLAYYASEVDKHAITVTQANYPHTIQLGSVTEWRTWDIDWSKIKLLMGGSPCQGFSAAGKQGGTKARLNGVEIVVNSLPMYHAIKAAGGEFLSQSHLFWEYVDILEHVKKYNPDVLYLLENVKMTKNNMDMITNALNVEPVFINSALVSAQNRQRYYWCNWKVTQPQDKGIVLADILEADGTGFIKTHGEYKERSEKSQCIDANYHKGADNHGQRTLIGARFNRKDGLGEEVKKAFSLNASDWGGLNRNQTQTAVVLNSPPGRYPVATSAGRNENGDRVLRAKGEKVPPITARYYKGVKSDGAPFVYNGDKEKGDSFDYQADKADYRKLTPTECERLQTVPDNYTKHVSNTQRYKMLGNGWTVDVIAHILKQALTPASLASNI